jgi:hypothetical protein
MMCVHCLLPLQAFPESLELRPQASGTIRMAFRPPRDGQYYSQVCAGAAWLNREGVVDWVEHAGAARDSPDARAAPHWLCAVQTLVVQSSVKVMQSFRLVQDDAVVPPWSTGILVSVVACALSEAAQQCRPTA